MVKNRLRLLGRLQQKGRFVAVLYSRLVDHFWVVSILFIVLLTGAMIACLELGRWIALRFSSEESHDKILPSVRQLDSTVCGLMSLLIAFAFYGAATRYYERDRAILDNVNAIEKSYRQTNLLPPELRQMLRRDLRNYVDCRLHLARRSFDVDSPARAAHCEELQYALIDKALALHDPNLRSVVPLSYALNEMASTWTAQKNAVQRHVHPAIYLLLIEIALIAAVLIGYTARSAPRSWLHRVCFGVVIMSTLYVAIDMEFPRVGLIQLQAPEQLLQQLRHRMNEQAL